MAPSPENHTRTRAPRVQLPGMPPTTVRLRDGQHSTARLQIISETGGLLRVLKPFLPGEIAEVMFWTDGGPVLGLAELLTPCTDVALGLQPFRFIAMDKTDLRTLHTAIAVSLENSYSH